MHEGTHWHLPAESHAVPAGQLPHEPPQPSEPHVFPEHDGVQVATHWPLSLQVPVAQAPQLPPQPSEPHCFPAHDGTHWHCPLAVQVWPPLQVPQAPPQPSGPHCFPVHDGEHAATHTPAAEQTSPMAQAPQPAPQLFAPHEVQRPFASQASPAPHAPHVPPQPSGPHDLPSHEGVQASAAPGTHVHSAPPVPHAGGAERHSPSAQQPAQLSGEHGFQSVFQHAVANSVSSRVRALMVASRRKGA